MHMCIDVHICIEGDEYSVAGKGMSSIKSINSVYVYNRYEERCCF